MLLSSCNHLKFNKTIDTIIELKVTENYYYILVHLAICIFFYMCIVIGLII